MACFIAKTAYNTETAPAPGQEVRSALLKPVFRIVAEILIAVTLSLVRQADSTAMRADSRSSRCY